MHSKSLSPGYTLWKLIGPTVIVLLVNHFIANFFTVSANGKSEAAFSKSFQTYNCFIFLDAEINSEDDLLKGAGIFTNIDEFYEKGWTVASE